MTEKGEKNFLIYLDAMFFYLNEMHALPADHPHKQSSIWLENLLNAIPQPQQHPELVLKVWAEVRKHPELHQAIMEKVWKQEAVDAQANSGTMRKFEILPGSAVPLPPGTCMVCPQDPTHYQRFIRTAGQHMVCPVHHCDLVPKQE